MGESLVSLRPSSGTSGRSERNQRGGVEFELCLGSLKELVVLGVGPRPATFDEIHSEAVEQGGDAQFVANGRRQPFALRAITQGGVVDLHSSRHMTPRKWETPAGGGGLGEGSGAFAPTPKK